MITSQIPAAVGLEELVRSIGLGWWLDLSGSPDARIAYLQGRLHDGDKAALEKFADGSVRLTLDDLVALARQSPDKVRAFVEQLFSQGASEILVMVWRVLNCADIGTMHIDLDQANRFHLEITLRPDRKGTEEKYESDDISDLYVLRQFGIAKLNGKLPLLIGFYPTWRPLT
jgi:hypothetical protein